MQKRARCYEDALTGCSLVLFDAEEGIYYDPEITAEDIRDTSQIRGIGSSEGTCESLFFPGCSLMNYAPELLEKTYDLLYEKKLIEGISLLCCGKLLEYEQNAEEAIFTFESRLMSALHAKGIRQIVAACPNCVATLRAALARAHESEIKVVALASLLHETGVEVPADVVLRASKGEGIQDSDCVEKNTLPADGRAPSCSSSENVTRSLLEGDYSSSQGRISLQAVLSGEAEEPMPIADMDDVSVSVVFSEDENALAPLNALEGADLDSVHIAVHDSCPDRSVGEFAQGVRGLFPEELLVEKVHHHKKSFCCGSLARAIGNLVVSEKASYLHGLEARAAGADLLVVACVSCARQLGKAQSEIPVCHYLELCFQEYIDWSRVPDCMTTRFLFEESSGTRDYKKMNKQVD